MWPLWRAGEQFGDGLGTGDVATAALLEIGLDRRG